MAKIKPILEFILALLNFLFHFKPSPDEENVDSVKTDPGPATKNKPKGPEPVSETDV